MIGMIVTGHGNFAAGISSSVKMIAGPQKNYEIVDFQEGDSGGTLREKLETAIERLTDCREIIIFSDLTGGSPFKTAAEISINSGKQIEVVSGTNAGMLIECAMMRESAADIDELVEGILKTGRNQVQHFVYKNVSEQEEDFGEGI